MNFPIQAIFLVFGMLPTQYFPHFNMNFYMKPYVYSIADDQWQKKFSCIRCYAATATNICGTIDLQGLILIIEENQSYSNQVGWSKHKLHELLLL